LDSDFYKFCTYIFIGNIRDGEVYIREIYDIRW